MLKSYFKLRKYYRSHIDHGLPFARSQDKRIKAMLELSEVRPGEKVIDLGAGDGKVVIAFARTGATVWGVEIDPILAEYNIRKKRLCNKAYIINGDFWKESLDSYDIITVYGMNYIMGKLENKFKNEAKPGCRFLSNLFKFPSWQPEKEKESVFLYVKK